MARNTIFLVAFSVLLHCSHVAAACANSALRIEWRDLSSKDKSAYLDAVNCLTTKPSKIGLNTTLYDDFPYIHNALDTQIHFVASFLPWHRYFVHVYETALRESCNYNGPMTYWNWELDSADPKSAPVFTDAGAFGGNGEGGAFINPNHPNPLVSCVKDGAFSNLTVAYYDSNIRPHCLNRGFSDGQSGDTEKDKNMMGALYSTAAVQTITINSAKFDVFAPTLEDGPHGAVHQALGGDMVPATSPNDPLFFLHHGQIDRLWWLWQQNNTEVRNLDFGGNRHQDPDTTPATIDDVMPMMGLSVDVTVREMMTTENDILCYHY